HAYYVGAIMGEVNEFPEDYPGSDHERQAFSRDQNKKGKRDVELFFERQAPVRKGRPDAEFQIYYGDAQIDQIQKGRDRAFDILLNRAEDSGRVEECCGNQN